MGWSGGAELADDIWELIESYIPKKKKEEVARDFVDLFENRDCDCMDETTVYEVANISDGENDDYDSDDYEE